jgi:NADPH-dependent curcumin reductase CurA
MADAVNHRLLLRSRPVDRVSLDNFTVDQAEVPGPGPGEAIIKTLYLSLDPTNRVWMAGDSYLPAVAEGEVMRGLGLGQVVASNDEKFPVGDLCIGAPGWQEYANTGEAQMPWNIVPRGTGLPPTTMLGALGMTGMTAYWGVTDVCRVKEGETFVVDGAAGAVGSVAGQVAKALGARVVGIAGTAEKCEWLVSELGFDAGVCYRDDDWREQLKAACPDGVDAQFENVGGEIMDGVFDLLNVHGRVAVCGLISDYNENRPANGPTNFGKVIFARLTVQGFLILDYGGRTMEALGVMVPWMQEGKLKHEETLVSGGVTKAPETLNMLFDGENRGKLILQVGESDLEVPEVPS